MKEKILNLIDIYKYCKIKSSLIDTILKNLVVIL
jgi:hypothetical protein